MKHVTKRMLADAIRALDAQFDTHAVEQRVLRHHPVEVASEIIEKQHCKDVLRQFSASFSIAIGRAFPGQLRKLRKVTSPNLGGRNSSNQLWG